MKIVQMIYELRQGGAERFVVNLANELAGNGHDVTILTLIKDKETNIFNKQFVSDRVKYESMGFERGFTIGKVSQVCRKIKKINPDIVHCNLNVIPYIFPAALGGKIKFVHTIHNLAQYATGGKLQSAINRWFYKTGKIIPVTISDQCQESFSDFYKLPEPVKIDNGASMVVKTPGFEITSEEISSYKTTDRTKVFLHMARCSEQKNQQLLVSSFNKIVEEGADAILLIIGADFDSEMGQSLKKQACGNIHFLGLKPNVSDYLLNADVFTLSSIYEGLPLSLLEALSAGVTPVCTPVGGIPDVIQDGIIGYLSKDDSVNSFAKTLRMAYDKPIKPEILKKHFEDNFSMAKCASAYEKLYT